MVQQNDLRQDYLLNGYIVIKSIFTKEYISGLREKMINLSNNDLDKYEILLNKDVQNLLLNEKLINIVKAILDTNNLLYYTDSSIVNHTNPFKNRNGFHNDARNEDPSIPFNDEYPIIRIGIYFENYKHFSGGLKVKKKSHKYFMFNFRKPLIGVFELMKIFFAKSRYKLNSLKLGKSINLELEQGDIVIWNLRTHHCGTSRRLKVSPKTCLQPFFEKMLPKSFFLPTQYKQDRCAIFSTFAKNDLNNNNIIGYLRRKTNFNRLNQIQSNPILLEKLSQLGCKLPQQKNK
jgi:hypothetical protein